MNIPDYIFIIDTAIQDLEQIKFKYVLVKERFFLHFKSYIVKRVL